MIKLFRNIRQKLIIEGKTAIYLRYAIGEIVLVVIGILIALQINNWNEQRKAHLKEIKMLSEVKSNLEANILNLESDIKMQIRGAWCIDFVIDHMDNKRPYNDSIPFYMVQIDFAPDVVLVSSAYETLQSSGLENIANDSLRQQLTNLYGVVYPTLMQETKRIEDQVWPSVVVPLIQKYFRRDFEKYSFIPTIYDKWLDDQEFLSMLAFRRVMRNNSTQRKKLAMKETENVLIIINNELKKSK
jgi:hypothetical protein